MKSMDDDDRKRQCYKCGYWSNNKCPDIGYCKLYNIDTKPKFSCTPNIGPKCKIGVDI